MFNEMFKSSPKFTYNADNNTYIGITDFLQDHDKDITYQVKGMFLTKEGNYGRRGIVILDGFNLYVPTHVNERIETIRKNPEMVAAINDGHCGLCFREYEDTKHGNKIRYTVDFVDM